MRAGERSCSGPSARPTEARIALSSEGPRPRDGVRRPPPTLPPLKRARRRGAGARRAQGGRRQGDRRAPRGPFGPVFGPLTYRPIREGRARNDLPSPRIHRIASPETYRPDRGVPAVHTQIRIRSRSGKDDRRWRTSPCAPPGASCTREQTRIERPTRKADRAGVGRRAKRIRRATLTRYTPARCLVAVESSSSPSKPNTCPACRRSVIWARFESRPGRATIIPVETCAEGAGDLSLVAPMFPAPGGMLEAQSVTNLRTRYRNHRDHCRSTAPARAAGLDGPFTTTGRRKERPA